MTDLSPAAQAVLDAALKYSTQAWSEATHQRFNLGIAAALRAAADQAQASVYHSTPTTDWGKGRKQGVIDATQGFLAIANELDPPNS